jgi:O-antigen/teichoic acid export membrane protein
MDRKIIRNYIYNALYQLVRIVLPFVLAPYTLSHLGTQTMGIYDYAGSIMNWFILFGILGVNTYGSREIAKVRDNRAELSRSFWEILLMQVCNMALAMAMFYLWIHFFVHKNVFYYHLTGLTMIASGLDISWFFFGVEDFKKASIRNTIVKCLGVTLIFTLVKSPEDLWLYILINVGSELFGQGIMFAQLHQYADFVKVSIRDAYRHHLKAAFQLFIPTIAISVYTMLDTTMVGALYSEDQVTLYKISMNIIKMFLTMITAIGTVTMPRVTNSFYHDADAKTKAEHLINATMKFVNLLAWPMCFGMMAIAPVFISWYTPEYPVIAQLVRIGCPIIILISISNVTGIQYMVPTGMFKQYTASIVSGSCVNFVSNLLLIPRYGALGAIIGSILAEGTVTVVQLVLIRHKVTINFRQRSYLIYAGGSLVMYGIVYGLGTVLPASALGTLIQVLAGMGIYLVILLITKEPFTRSLLQRVREKKDA